MSSYLISGPVKTNNQNPKEYKSNWQKSEKDSPHKKASMPIKGKNMSGSYSTSISLDTRSTLASRRLLG